ncbi:hypothetical protein ACJX0J_031973, partial [Zea mays]
MTTAISIEDVRTEVKILKALSGHSNLVKFYDACEDALNVYIMMELCEGGELLDRILSRYYIFLRNHFANTTTRCSFGTGVVHRDLKPEVCDLQGVAAPAAVSVPEGKSAKKGKRNAEDEIEKAVSAKKQKTVPEKVVPVKKQPPPKKVESNNSDEDSSDSEVELCCPGHLFQCCHSPFCGASNGPILFEVKFFWPAVMMISAAFQATASIIKEFVFIKGAKRLEGKRPDIFVVNSFGSGFQALFIFLLLPFLSNLKGIPFAELPSYLTHGVACFLNVGGNLK